MDLLDCACYLFKFAALQISQKRRFLHQHEQASGGTSSHGENTVFNFVMKYFN